MDFKQPVITMILIFILLLTNNAKATLISENWSFIVNEVRGNYISVGHQSVITILVEYESNSLIGHEYNDDGSITKKCALTEAFKSDCDENWLEWSLMANAEISGYKELFDSHQMTLDGGNWFDSMPFIGNLRFSSISVVNGRDYVTAQSDKGDLSLNKRADIDPSFSQAHARFEYTDNNGTHQVSSVTGEIVTLKTVEVPEPLTFTIFALGMFGLVLRRFKE